MFTDIPPLPLCKIKFWMCEFRAIDYIREVILSKKGCYIFWHQDIIIIQYDHPFTGGAFYRKFFIEPHPYVCIIAKYFNFFAALIVFLDLIKYFLIGVIITDHYFR